ncbi:uncharacterized protein LOC132798281 [Drosophila nasuta]|uniref:uncharacterized protein LOC132798281 n=1 Tax=Drosophila nasuta TaxID=42062 RepID=UPI00295E8F5B|nr:uncharacterized protein LOC132798281 [Drosophila nasuta]XP_060666064.1 uncharacterized protein LOC132798281 [Drosophila nasuta]
MVEVKKRPAKKRKIKEQSASANTTTAPCYRVEDVTISDVLTIYSHVPKLQAVERYLNLLYRPFTCQVNTKCRYKLSEMASFLSMTCYEPNKHSALLVRIPRPACNLKVYANGMIISQGYSYESAALGIHRMVDYVEEFGYRPVISKLTFNVVNATFSMPFAIDLNGFYEQNLKLCRYDPQTNPYLTYEMPDSIVKLTIFPQGFVYVLLACSPRLTQDAISQILPLLYRHRVEELVKDDERELLLSFGDINFTLLWEKEFQSAFQHIPGQQRVKL